MTERLWMSSPGARYSLICGAYTKYALENSRPSPAEQLEMVEDLVRLQTGDVTKAAKGSCVPSIVRRPRWSSSRWICRPNTLGVRRKRPPALIS